LHVVPALLIATTNPDKVAEIVPILDGLPFRIQTLADYPRVEAPAETGRTFAENARLKATYYAAVTGALVVAEDSGLAVEALDGAPGVESARYGGADASYPEKFRRLYEALRARNAPGSPARFVCAVALAGDNRVLFETEGIVEGRIADRPAGTGGFGYDPIFFYPPFGATLAEAADRKSTVSHRGQAFRKLREYLLQWSDREAPTRSGEL
jgi:XTP/dITP diphosphohydrolase